MLLIIEKLAIVTKTYHQEQGRQSFGGGLQIRQVRRLATHFLNFGSLKQYFQRFGDTYKNNVHDFLNPF